MGIDREAQDAWAARSHPARRGGNALERGGLEIADLDLIEINEAFASVAVHATRMLGADEDIVNVDGDSVALGHALGSTGARMLVTLVRGLTAAA